MNKVDKSYHLNVNNVNIITQAILDEGVIEDKIKSIGISVNFDFDLKIDSGFKQENELFTFE